LSESFRKNIGICEKASSGKARVISGGRLGEKLVLKRLSNGLECGVIRRPGFAKKFAVVAAKYGSIDNRFIPPGARELVEMPAGVAHFLEHKMFEKRGTSYFDMFSELGANANAFTSHTITAYYFNCTGHFWESLCLLLQLVQSVHLSARSVRKEVGIIQQEIRACQDNPGWVLSTGLLAALYSKHPVRIDTAGTIESVARITKDILLDCFNTFYSPANMMLLVTGALEAEEVFEKCEKVLQPSPVLGVLKRLRVREPSSLCRAEITRHMEVERPKLLVGFKETRPAQGGPQLLQNSIQTELLLELMFGKSSRVYQQLYEKGLIDESFSASYMADRGFGYTALGGETDSPRKLLEEILKAVRGTQRKGISRPGFERVKKRVLGAYLRRFNTLEAAAMGAVAGRFLRYNSFKMLDIVESISIVDINERLRIHLNEEKMAVSAVLPPGTSGRESRE